VIIPLEISLKDWAASLVIDFPDDNIPILTDENDWKNWGCLVVEQTSFADNGAPSPILFDEVNKWTMAMFNSMVNF
jgi:hypothetical protein